MDFEDTQDVGIFDLEEHRVERAQLVVVVVGKGVPRSATPTFVGVVGVADHDGLLALVAA